MILIILKTREAVSAMAQENREMTNLEISHDPSINGQH